MAGKRVTGFFLLVLSLTCCTSEIPEGGTNPFIIIKSSTGLMTDGGSVPPGGTLRFGISATGGGGVITNLVVKRVADGVVKTETDLGLFKEYGGLDTTLIYTRGYAAVEKWRFFIMNSFRDTASVVLTVYRGDGSAWGEIDYYPLITIGFQSNTVYPCYLDLHTGVSYDALSVPGNEGTVDLAAFWYITSGKSSPTLTCPAYPSAQTYYPFGSWQVKNQTLYDYYTSDNELVTPAMFDQAKNDSLLVNAYRSQSVSGLCKYAGTGKVIPFRTGDGKYGMIRVIRADEEESGSMEIAVKIQQ